LIWIFCHQQDLFQEIIRSLNCTHTTMKELSSLCDHKELQLMISLIKWLLIASLSIKGRLSSIICSIIRRDQRIIWNILWVNSISRSHLSYKRTNLPAYILFIIPADTRWHSHKNFEHLLFLRYNQQQIHKFMWKI